MDLGLKGKTAVVTGSSQGIGLAAAMEFLREGARVIVCARRENTLKDSLSLLSDLGEVWGMTADVTEEAEVYRLAEYAVTRTGRLDCWVNNVGGSFPKEGDEYTGEQMDRITKLCFHSTVYGCQAAFRHMKSQGGAIVNISSLAARCGTVGASTLYGPLKSAVVHLSTMFAGEYAAYGVRVNAVLPGFTMTPMVEATIAPDYLKENQEATLLRRMARPEEIARPVVFLSGDGASYITGTSLEVSGGRSIVLNPSYSFDKREQAET